MHLANQSSGKLDNLSQSSMGDTLDKRKATDPRGNDIQEAIQCRAEGNARLGNNQDIGLPMLQEARSQA